ncbi:unnamed protein product [Clonostachys solani]|uniref:Polycomb protein VEFS-Box domain-containing protein n=1 Tax=Clonostachys solani TaxID=160281 RepID=A0A9N9ZHA1_9HYPO|nr:unnamed protein product [Clonostachys solani]
MTPESHRSLPFLKRNFARALHSLTSTFGSPQENGSARDIHDGESPRKRRRLSSPSLATIDHLLADPRDSEHVPDLRIEVLKCCHVSSKMDKSGFASVVSSSMNTKAICRITISDVSYGRSRVLHAEGQPCEVVTFQNSTSPHQVLRIHLPRPFYVSRNSLLVHNDSAIGLSDAYRISVELEAADATAWPPLEGQDLGIPAHLLGSSIPGQWVFNSQFDQLFGRLKSRVDVQAGFAVDAPAHETDYQMDIDLRWTTGLKSTKGLNSDPKCLITTSFDPEIQPLLNGQLNHSSPESTIHLRDSLLFEHEDDDNEGTGPSRTLRHRGPDKNYNLKALSDKAHGTLRKRRMKEASKSWGLSQIRYLLPPDQPLCLDGFRCISCGMLHRSLNLLHIHLQSHHPDHEYKLETTSQGPQFLVSFRTTPAPVASKDMQLGPAIKPFHLETFVRNDHSWLTSRLGSESKDDFFASTDSTLVPDSSDVPITKPRNRTKTLPIVAAAIEPTPRRKVVIPNIGQEFYHPVSKQVLKPGDEVLPPQAEERWFHHKHREGLNENQGLASTQLEYIKEFDSVMREYPIGAKAYFPRAWLDFVQRKVGWLLDAKHRMLEFSMHWSYLLATDLVTDGHIKEAMEFIKAEREKRRRSLSADTQEASDQIRVAPAASDPPQNLISTRKSARGCGSCELPVLGKLVVCSNKACITLLEVALYAPVSPFLV